MEGDNSTPELMKLLNIKHRPTFMSNYIRPAINLELIKMTIPETPKTKKQRYILTEKGKKYITGTYENYLPLC